MRSRTSTIRILFFLCLAIAAAAPAPAGQVMDEVWFPGGVIRWGPTQTTPDILQGIRETMSYYATRTPLQLTEIANINQGGMSTPEQLGTLEIRYSEGIFNYAYGGETKHYRKPDIGQKMVKLSFENIKSGPEARSTLAHEMGHVLGFTHEFQRWDRGDNGVKVSFALGRDPYNGGRPDKKNVRVLSPYDFQSKFATGYSGATPPHNGPPGRSLLSQHDINSIYRVYGKPLGSMSAGVLYGEAAASGDFDGDGFDDLAIAAQYKDPGSDQGAIYFYKGVAQAPEEVGAGTTYVGWFREDIQFAAGQKRSIVLTTGDTHTMTDPATTATSGDGIAELIVGLPGAARVEIWVVNANGRFSDGFGTFGGHGIGKKIVIQASDVGITRGAESSEFGASLAAGRFFKASGDDLAIGAPTGATVVRPMTLTPGGGAQPGPIASGGPAVYLLPNVDPGRAIELSDPDGDPANGFGSALAVMKELDHGHDTLVVGAPGTDTSQGKVHVYRRAYYDGSGRAIAPELLDAFSGSTTGGGFGRAVTAFTTRESDSAPTEHWIAIGAPTTNLSGVRCGSLDLFRFDLSGERHSEHRMLPSNCQEGMHFGRAVAIRQGICTSTLCPKDHVRIAIGAPQAIVAGRESGQVTLWDVWEGGEVNRSREEAWDGANDDARFGQDVVAVRARQSGGGFLILGKNTELPVFNGTVVNMIKTGFGQLRLNKEGATKWSSWILNLGPARGGDTPPKNR